MWVNSIVQDQSVNDSKNIYSLSASANFFPIYLKKNLKHIFVPQEYILNIFLYILYLISPYFGNPCNTHIIDQMNLLKKANSALKIHTCVILKHSAVFFLIFN